MSLLELDVYAVVYVLNCSEIQDKIGQEFQKKFYTNIFNGNTIQNSFDNTLIEL